MSEIEPRAEHVFVTDISAATGQRSPGLLLARRRRRDGGWAGWVVAAQLDPAAAGGETSVRQGWVRAESIHRVGGQA